MEEPPTPYPGGVEAEEQRLVPAPALAEQSTAFVPEEQPHSMVVDQPEADVSTSAGDLAAGQAL
eukprot:790757-Lingulodinium_polyedra.AAC.1